jgi:hypothetical protein
MLFRSVLILFPLAALAQTGSQTPPSEVDQALRGRVTEFFNYHVEGATGFRKAMELVADDTKDYYFSAQKIQFKSFKIDSITYSDHFTRAVVTLSGRRMFRVSPQFPETEISQPMSTTWKIDNGKWCWYRDDTAETSLTPMGPSDPKAIGPSTGGMVPRDLSQGEMDKRAQEVLKQSKISKTEVTLAASHPSSEQVVFHNGQPGSVLLSVDVSPKVAGFSAVLDKTNINAGEDVGLKIHYDPAGKNGAPGPVTVRVIVAPFNQAFPVTVKFASE